MPTTITFEIPASIQGLIFDCDGTLTDSMPVHYLAWKQMFDQHEIAFTEERFYSLGGVPSDKIIAELSEEHGKTVAVAEAAHEKEQLFVDLIAQVLPVQRVVDLAREQKGHRKLAVASGGYRWVIDKQLNHIGLGDWFDAIVTAEDTPRHKPHPDVFFEAARQLGVPAEACLVFEDADLGVEAANRAGMQVIDVRHPDWGSSSA